MWAVGCWKNVAVLAVLWAMLRFLLPDLRLFVGTLCAAIDAAALQSTARGAGGAGACVGSGRESGYEGVHAVRAFALGEDPHLQGVA